MRCRQDLPMPMLKSAVSEMGVNVALCHFLERVFFRLNEVLSVYILVGVYDILVSPLTACK